MISAFKIGDRIRGRSLNGAPATVTELTERGFKYIYDEPYCVVPRLGIKIAGGECYTDVHSEFPQWTLESAWTPEFSELTISYDTNRKK